MSVPMTLAVLSKLMPGGFEYGKNYLVEFDPPSVWYETSVTIAAQAILNGVKCEYHVFQHGTDETLQSLQKLGLETRRLISQERLRIIDSYTPATKLGMGEDAAHSDSWSGRVVFDLKVWAENIRKEILAGVSEVDSRWLHIDDNFSVLLQFFNETDLLDFYRTAIIPWTRARKLLMFTSLVTKVTSEAFYRKFEAFCDGIIDFRSEEQGGRIKQYVRIRNVRERFFESQWQSLRLQHDGKISLVPGPEAQEFGFKEKATRAVFDCLVDSFIEDYMTRNINAEKSGWRTLVEISKGARISTSLLYAQHAKSGPIFRELTERGLLETKLFPGERGRGGTITRIRIAYAKEPVKTFVDEMVKIRPRKSGRPFLAPS